MSDDRKNKISAMLKHTGLAAAWIIGIFIAGGALLFLLQGPKSNSFIRSLNRNLESRGYGYVLDRPVSAWGLPGWVTRTGTWYFLKGSRDLGLTVTVFTEGIQAGCLAILSEDGNIRDLIPITENSDEMISRLSGAMLDMHIGQAGLGRAVLEIQVRNHE